MNDIQIGQAWQLHWFWVIVACGLVAIYGTILRHRAIRRFATPLALSKNTVARNAHRDLLISILALASMSLLIIAMMDLRWGKVWREVPQKGIEVIFVLDVSRSMLAEDVSPNRLERAKQQIGDIIDEMSGDRIGLVVFSGEVRQKIPLTSHYEDFRQRLRNVGPEDVPRGGSRLGDAIRVASRAFLDKMPDHKAIVVFSDGEDMQSDPTEAARAAKTEHGIRIFCVGLGDSEAGAKVPGRARGRFVQYEGKIVWSKLNGEILKQVADESGGAYIPAGTKQVNMAQVYHAYIASVEQGEFTTARINSYEARYQWFLGPAILMLLVELWLGTQPQPSYQEAAADQREFLTSPPRKPISETMRNSSLPTMESPQSLLPGNRTEQNV